MDLKNILLFMTVGANVGLAFFIYLKNRTNKINIYFSVMLFFIAAWSFEIAMFRASEDAAVLQKWFNSFYLTAALIALIFFYFTHAFPFEIKKITPKTTVVNLLTTVTIAVIIILGGMASQIFYSPTGDHSVALIFPNYYLYIIYFVGYIVISFIQLLKKIAQSSAYMKKMIIIVFLSTLLSALAGSIFDLFLPFITYKYIWIGPLFTLAMVFIIVRYVFIKEPE